MRLLVDSELDKIEQKFSVDRNLCVSSLRAGLLAFDVADTAKIGMEIWSPGGKIAETALVSGLQILSGSKTFYGLVNFSVAAMLRGGETYTLKFRTQYYSPESVKYFAALFDFDFKTNKQTNPVHPLLSPLHFEVWTESFRYPVRKLQ